MENPNALPIGAMIGDYKLERVLGFGGFGITYKALDLRLGASVALKEYFPQSMAIRRSDFTVQSRPESQDGSYAWGLDRFQQEAMMLANLRHSNIVGVNRFFRANCTAYMVIDFIEGPSFKQWLESLGRATTQRELEAVLFPLLGALDTVHEKGLLHRDIAPKNIMISQPLTPILIDFGAARNLVAQRSHTFAALMTPGYAPFEQYVASGHGQGPWTDIYALGATVYTAITGHPPPEATERTLDDRCVPAREVGRGRYSHEFLAAVDWALMPLPNDRPQSIAEWTTRGFAGSCAATYLRSNTQQPKRRSWSGKASSPFTKG